MGPASRPERHSRHLPDTPPDSNLSRSPSAASPEISRDKYISQPPRTYRPTGRKVERGGDPHSHSQERGNRSSRIKPRVHDQSSYHRGGTSWDYGIGRPVFKEHHKRQSERLPGNGDRIFFTVGIDTQRHTRRASLTLPKPLGEPCFSSSRRPRIAQDRSQRESSGRHSGPRVPSTDDNNRDVRPKRSSGARRDSREKTSEGTRKSSKRDQENCVRPKLTEENVILNARRASPSNRPDVRDAPTRPPFTDQTTIRRERNSRSKQYSKDPPASRVPIQKVRSCRGETDRSSKRVDTYSSRDRGDRVSRGRRRERRGSRTVPITVGDSQEEEAVYRPRSPPLASYSVDRRSKLTQPTRTKRRSSNGDPPTSKEVGLDSSPPTSDMSAHTDYSVYETRRTVRRKQTQQTTCSCTVS